MPIVTIQITREGRDTDTPVTGRLMLVPFPFEVS